MTKREYQHLVCVSIQHHIIIDILTDEGYRMTYSGHFDAVYKKNRVGSIKLIRVQGPISPKTKHKSHALNKI